MSNLAAVFQIGSLGDSIVSIPTLLSIREFLPDCREYLLISRFDTKAKVLPADIFGMAWKPKLEVNYTNPEQRLKTAFTLTALLAKLRYYRPRYCVYLMPTNREPERVKRDIQFFKAGGVKNLLGFETMQPSFEGANHRIDIVDTEAHRKFKRLWGDSAAAKFPQYARSPLMQPGVAEFERVHQWLEKNRRHPEKRLIALAPFSNLPSKDIPEKTILDLLRRLKQEADAEIVMVGGGKDFSRAADILSAGAGGMNACGVFSVAESAALLKAAKLAVCADSGPMHLAAAVGIPVLAAFGRINKRLAQWLPLGDNVTLLYREVPCAGCDAIVCPVAGHPCMQDITSDEMVSAALKILSSVPVVEVSPLGTRVFTWNRPIKRQTYD